MERHRLIRFENIVDYDRPRLLSYFDKEKNLLHIDREEAECLPKMIQDTLIFTEIEYTRVSDDGMRFEQYERPRNTFLAD